jgi:predicted deacylase
MALRPPNVALALVCALDLAACRPARPPETAHLVAVWAETRSPEPLIAALRETGRPATDPALPALLARWLRDDEDALWLAAALAEHGPEPLWPLPLLAERRTRLADGAWSEPVRAVLAKTAEGRSVEAFFVAGTTDARALVVGGVHGSEQSGIEATEALLDDIRSAPPTWTTLVVPVLFPDNAAGRIREDPTQPTNRNFPPPGRGIGGTDPDDPPLDALGRPMLPENVAFVALMGRYQPSRVASVHATVRPGASGVFSDPHTTGDDAATAVAEAAAQSARAEALALQMAQYVAEAGHPGAVEGNDLQGEPHAEWSGSVHGGTSLGGWGPRAVTDGSPVERPAATVITVELPGQHRSDDPEAEDPAGRRAEVLAFADAIRRVFLER